MLIAFQIRIIYCTHLGLSALWGFLLIYGVKRLGFHFVCMALLSHFGDGLDCNVGVDDLGSGESLLSICLYPYDL